jgi:two-component system chemotaxis response regulator CheY
MSKTPPPEPVKPTTELPAFGSEGSGPVILVLDDEWAICEAVEEALASEGFATVSLTDGLRGIEYLQHAETLPAAIVLDLMMPHMDGWSFFDKIRAYPRLRDIPIVVLTAAGPHWGYPVSRVLRKPILTHELIAAVKGALEAKPPPGEQPPMQP